jgi:hypothetical protein
MNVGAVAAYAARIGDLLAEARAELPEEDFDELLALAAATIAKRVADRLEERWMGGR